MNLLQAIAFILMCAWSLIVHAGEAGSWLRPLAEGWHARPLMYAGDGVAGYRMAGIPDGLGAYASGDGAFVVLMNHELAADKGTVRTHGGKGAFISRWVIDVETLEVRSGSDLVRQTAPVNIVFHRLCSADLPPPSTFYDAASGRGYSGRLFMNGEEDKRGGRAFAHTLDGMSYVLPALGRIAWENVVVRPDGGARTVVIGLDDIQGGVLLVYIGSKRSQGTPVEQAGLVGGMLYALKRIGERFTLVALKDVERLDGEALRGQAVTAGATTFSRPEDGAWDTRNSEVFWFTTTDRIGGESALLRLVFDDTRDPLGGGRIEMVLPARDIGAEMFDNLTVDAGGRVLIQEDPGAHDRLAAIWMFDPASGKATRLFEADPAYFGPGGDNFLTLDEEHSGIIEITDLLVNASWFDASRRYYLGTTQAHLRHPADDVVEYGQLWMISGPR